MDTELDIFINNEKEKDDTPLETQDKSGNICPNFLKIFLIHLKVFLKTFLVFSLTLLLLYFAVKGLRYIYISIKKNAILKSIPEPKLTRELPLFPNPIVDYEKTVQVWDWPPLQFIDNYLYWLSGYENCLFATRMNAMKQAGMIPKDWQIEDFKKYFTPKELYEKWGINGWDITLNDEILDEMNRRINKDSPYRYRWFSINSMDELIYLVKKGYHVMVGITVWKKPTKKYPYPRKNRDANISHSITITGIDFYDPKNNLIKFETYDPIPKSEVSPIPVYNRYYDKDFNILGVQGVPYITTGGRARSGYIYRELKDPDVEKNRREKRLK